MVQRPGKEPILQLDRKPIVLGSPFILPASEIYGSQAEMIQITPEVVVQYEQGNVLTSQVVYHIDPPLLDPLTGETIAEIAQGKFGQNDLIRLWFTANFAGDIMLIPGDIQEKIDRKKRALGPDAKINLDESLYEALNVVFFVDPYKHLNYGSNSPYSRVHWKNPPPEVLDEIEARIARGDAQNYIYLAYVIQKGAMWSVNQRKFSAEAFSRGNRLKEASMQHRQDMYHPDVAYKYAQLNKLLEELDITVEYEGKTVLDNSALDTILSMDMDRKLPRIMTDEPAINAAATFVIGVLAYLEYHIGEFLDAVGPRQYLAMDHIWETLIRRIYSLFTQNGVDIRGRTLGNFASELCQLYITNHDRQLYEFIPYPRES